MAPFEQQRGFLQSVYPLRDDSTDELRIDERANQKVRKDNKHADRDYYGDDSDYSDDYSATSTTAVTLTPASATPTSLSVSLSSTIQPPLSLVCFR
jgi:hypothetical protein